MTNYYIMREVKPGTVCSHRVGITYVDDVFRTSDDAERCAERYNHFVSVAGVRYYVLPHSDREPLPMDYFEPKGPIKYQTVLVG